MKRQHEGSLDYVSAQSWFADVIAPLKRGLTALERDEGYPLGSPFNTQRSI